MKKLLTMISATTLLAGTAVTTACGSAKVCDVYELNNKPKLAPIVASNNNIGSEDNGFNQQAYEGLYDFANKQEGNMKGKLYTSVDLNTGEGKNLKDVKPSGKDSMKGNPFIEFAGHQTDSTKIAPWMNEKGKNHDTIIAPGFTFIDTFQSEKLQVLGKNSKTNFILIDGQVDRKKNIFSDNLYTLVYREDFAGFSAGYELGLKTLEDQNAKKINFTAFGGLMIDPIKKYAKGFRDGMIAADKGKGILNWSPGNILGGFDVKSDVIEAKTKALVKKENDAIIPTKILGISAPDMGKAITTMKENKEVEFVGVDVDMAKQFPDANLKYSAIKPMRETIRDILLALEDGTQLGKKDYTIDTTNPFNANEKYSLVSYPKGVTASGEFDKTLKKYQELNETFNACNVDWLKDPNGGNISNAQNNYYNDTLLEANQDFCKN